MGVISLKGLKFDAYHGYYDKERELGNEFEVDISVTTDFYEAAIGDDLEKTVDYEDLYAIVEDEMKHTSLLLEHVVQKIVDRVLIEHKAVKKVKVSLTKFNPPIKGPCSAAVVTASKKRQDTE